MEASVGKRLMSWRMSGVGCVSRRRHGCFCFAMNRLGAVLLIMVWLMPFRFCHDAGLCIAAALVELSC